MIRETMIQEENDSPLLECPRIISMVRWYIYCRIILLFHIIPLKLQSTNGYV